MYKKIFSSFIAVILMLVVWCNVNALEASNQTKIMKVGDQFEIGIDRMWESENPDIVKIEYRPCPAFPNGTHDYAVAIAPGTATLKNKSNGDVIVVQVVDVQTVTPTVLPTNNSYISGFINPDLTSNDQHYKAGFIIELFKDNTVINTVQTDEEGFFTINTNLGETLDIVIKKDDYLTRIITGIQGSAVVSLGSVDMWAGDINRDGVVNISDIMEIAKAFSAINGNENYSSHCDLNKDDVVNLQDVMITARHFNKVPSDYPIINLNPTPVPTPTPTSTSTSTPSLAPVKVTGVVSWNNLEGGFYELTPGRYVLSGSKEIMDQIKNLVGVQVELTGYPHPEWNTTTMYGIPFVVIEVDPLITPTPTTTATTAPTATPTPMLVYGNIVYNNLEGGFYELTPGKYVLFGKSQEINNKIKELNGMMVKVTGYPRPDSMTTTMYGTPFEVLYIEQTWLDVSHQVHSPE